MCLSIPGKLLSITEQLDDTFRIGKVSFGGIMKQVNLSMVPEANVGDYVLVHVGVAIGLIDEEEAEKTFEYIRQVGELNELNDPLAEAKSTDGQGEESRTDQAQMGYEIPK